MPVVVEVGGEVIAVEAVDLLRFDLVDVSPGDVLADYHRSRSRPAGCVRRAGHGFWSARWVISPIGHLISGCFGLGFAYFIVG